MEPINFIQELDYLFQRLIRYFTYRLIKRHPTLFKSIAPSVSINVPHQFQEAMDQKTEEFTGDLFTKSESRTEDLIEMMSDVQKNLVHKFDDDGDVTCFERKIISGDQKTEKNSHFGILSKLDESTSEAIPISMPCNKSKIFLPGWNDIVKPFKEEASHWRSLWLCAGKPNNSILYTNMKSSKAQYKYAIRRLKKSADQTRNNKFLENILYGQSRN